MPCSFAMALGVSLDDFLNQIGHDGSDILWPHLGEPRQRKGFMLEECIYATYKLGRTATTLPFYSRATPDGSEYRDFRISDQVKNGRRGVLLGTVPGGGFHAVCWTGTRVLDPSRGEYILTGKVFRPHTFILVI